MTAYALSITAAFDEKNCEAIEAKNGIVASVGSKKQVSFTVVPGSESDLTITMDAVQFAMDPISINGVPMSMDIGGIDTTSLKEQMADLEQGAIDLDDGVSALSDGVAELDEGTDDLSDGSGQVSKAMRTLKSAAGSLRTANAQVEKGIGALSDAATLLESYHEALLSGTAALTDPTTQKMLAQANAGLNAYADPETGLPAKGAALCEGVDQIAAAMSPLIQALNLVADFIDTLDSITQGIAGCGDLIGDLPSAGSNLDQVIGMLNAAKSDLSGILTPIASAQIDAAISLLTAARGKISAVEEGFGRIDLSGFLNQREQLVALGASLREKANAVNEAINGENGLVAGTKAYVAAVNDYIALVTAYQSGINRINDGAQELSGGVESYLDGASQLHDGIDGLNTSYAQMSAGVKSFTAGVRKLADNYANLDEGIQSLVGGVDELADGVAELASGTMELRESTTGAGDRVDEEVNKALERFKNEGYVAPSFTSEKNHPTLVQFVIKYKGVTLPEKAQSGSQTAGENDASLNQLRSLLGG